MGNSSRSRRITYYRVSKKKEEIFRKNGLPNSVNCHRKWVKTKAGKCLSDLMICRSLVNLRVVSIGREQKLDVGGLIKKNQESRKQNMQALI